MLPASSSSAEFPLKRPNLSTLAADLLRDQIHGGKWKNHLPGEYELCRQLQISRQTLRVALGNLCAEGVIVVRKGFRTQITNIAKKPNKKRQRIIRFISSETVSEYDQFTFDWINELRHMLLLKGFSLQLHHPIRIYKRYSSKYLEAYIKDNEADIWILHLSTYKMQRWFMDQKIPAILAGTPHIGINLPFVDVHYRAIARHAAGELLAVGHRNIVFICPDRHYAGDFESIQGAREAISSHAGKDSARLEVIEYSDEPDNLYWKLNFLLNASQKPTAIITSSALIVSGIYSALNSLHLCIPANISLISLQGERSFNYITPKLSYYDSDSRTFAKKLTQVAIHILNKESIPEASNWIIPKYIAGKSVAKRNYKKQ